MSETDHLALAAEFPPATAEQWRQLVDAVLKGKPFETLEHTTYDGLRIAPLYTRVDAEPIGTRQGAWQIVQRVDHPDPATANAQALHDLENGATGLTLVFAGSVGDYGFGLPPGGTARALENVRLDGSIAVELDLAPQTTDVPAEVAAHVKAQGLQPGQLDIRLSFDPIGALAYGGHSLVDWPALRPRFAAVVEEFAASGFGRGLMAADGRVIHNAGGSEAQELAFVLATALDYLRALEAAGMTVDRARDLIAFRLSADADQFMTTAKFRALRKLWARVEDACRVAPKPAFVAAETAWRMLSQRDAYVNLLRTTIAVAGAAIGGADSITVLPFTAPIGLPDRFARRLARNTQLILLEESHLARVADPAAGSGALVSLTDQLCAAAWSLLQEIEAAGGAVAALKSGLIQAKVEKVRAARRHAVAHRTDALTGTSDYPDLMEDLAQAHVERRPVAAPAKPPVPPAGLSIEPLPRIRLAEPFERLRDASDRVLAETGARPKIFLANLGTPADFITRANFAKSFFEAGGIEAIMNDGYGSHAEMAAAFDASGAKLACLCSSDAVYEREAEPAARALADAGAAYLYLTGRPRGGTTALGSREVTLIHAGCDALAILTAAHARLGTGLAPEPA